MSTPNENTNCAKCGTSVSPVVPFCPACGGDPDAGDTDAGSLTAEIDDLRGKVAMAALRGEAAGEVVAALKIERDDLLDALRRLVDAVGSANDAQTRFVARNALTVAHAAIAKAVTL